MSMFHDEDGISIKSSVRRPEYVYVMVFHQTLHADDAIKLGEEIIRVATQAKAEKHKHTQWRCSVPMCGDSGICAECKARYADNASNL